MVSFDVSSNNDWPQNPNIINKKTKNSILSDDKLKINLIKTKKQKLYSYLSLNLLVSTNHRLIFL